MSGRTGKMTAEALRERGPRIVLARGADGKMFYFRENEKPAGLQYSVVAKSYSMNYLKKLEAGNQ